MFNKLKGSLCLILATILLFPLSACGKEENVPNYNLSLPPVGKVVGYTFADKAGSPLSLSDKSAAHILDTVENTPCDYAYTHLYQLDEVKKRLQFDATVDKHTYSALNKENQLDASHFCKVVEINNKAFMKDDPFGYENVEKGYLEQLCTFIVEVVSVMRQRCPDIDWERVYCNLGNLKILYKTGMLSYAEVSKDQVLAINKNNTEIILNMKGENGFRNVLTHETMHILQLGCACENIPGCERRAGTAVYWEDFTLNTTDWSWMIEGAAERYMCSLTGDDAVSYQYKMDYLCSLNMIAMLRKDTPADIMESLTFDSDPEKLFTALGCTTQQQRDEVLNMLITTNVLQMRPKVFYDLLEDEDINSDAFSYSLKPAICLSMAKIFYRNLTAFLRENTVTDKDLYCLLTLFEGTLNQHLRYTDEAQNDINEPFFDGYLPLRNALFAALQTDNTQLNIADGYKTYDIVAGEKTLNAILDSLPEEKRTFLAERGEWLDGLKGLGVTVPDVSNQ